MRSASISSCGGAGPGASHDGAAPRAHDPRLSDSRRGVLSPGRPRRWRLPGGDDQADRRTPARARPRPPRRWSPGFGRQRPSTPTVVSGWNPCPPFDFERRDCRSGRGQTRRPPPRAEAVGGADVLHSGNTSRPGQAPLPLGAGPAEGVHLAPPHPGHEEESRDSRRPSRPRSRATWSDSTPRPRHRGRWQVVRHGGQVRRSRTPAPLLGCRRRPRPRIARAAASTT